MSYSGIRTLTISPEAWPCTATPLRPRRRRGRSPAEGFSSSWTPRLPLLGRPSSSLLPPLEGEVSSSSSSFSREECVSDSSDDESDTTICRELFRVPVAFFFLAFFSGTTYGAGTSSFTRRAGAGSSGKGAGQLISPDFACQSYQR